MRKIHPVLFVPGTAFWGLFVVGMVTHNDALIGVGAAIAAVFVVAIIVHKVKASGAAREDRRRVVREGAVTTAKVVSIGSKGGGINDHPIIDLELDVASANEPAYRVVTSALISQLAIPRIQPGCEIRVHVDPRDRTNLIVDAALTPYGH